MPNRPKPKVLNRADQKGRRQELRTHMTQAERLLWWELRQEKLLGFRFRRQHGVGPYIADFYCPAAKLAIELDGDSHFDPDAKKSDAARDAYFELVGVSVLRFTNWDLFENRPVVLRAIARKLEEHRVDD